MTAPKKKAAKKATTTRTGKPSGRTSARNNGKPGQADSVPVPATRAGDLKVGDVIYPPVSGTSAGVQVERIETFRVGDIDRVRLYLYGKTTGLRTNVAFPLDALVNTEPLP